MVDVASILLTAGAKEASSSAKSLIATLGRDGYNQLMVKFTDCFGSHIQSTYGKCAKVKNILYRDQSVPLLSQYVNIKLQSGTSSKADSWVVQQLLGGQTTLVSGTAGAGKTMFMRWATLSMIDSMGEHGKIPLYLELRYVDEASLGNGLIDCLYNSTSAIKGKANFAQFSIGLKAGLFVVILDAVDEVSLALKDRVVSGVQDLIRDYPATGILISSRPDESLESIQDFAVLRTKAMTQPQIISVINKLEYDETVKASLIERIINGLFKSHEEFLSNPLLATIMLLTFDHSAGIPTKLTSFYRQAFEVLYQRHDAAKGAYRRGHHAGLPLDLYERLFSLFCFESYLDYKTEFSDSLLLDYFRSAADYLDVDVDPDLLVKDAMQSVCVIQKEGLDNTFVHKSFQEYFTALFISNYREDDVNEVIQRVAFASQSDNVMTMLLEISPEVVEYDWLLGKLESWLSEFGKIRLNTRTGFSKFFQGHFSAIYISPDTGVVEYVSHNSFRMSGQMLSTRWMSVAERSYSPNIRLSGLVFDANNGIFDSLEVFLKSIDVATAPNFEALMNRLEPSPYDEDGDRECIPLHPGDSSWLLATRLPERFEQIRRSVRQLKNEIDERRQARRSSIKKLLVRQPGKRLT